MADSRVRRRSLEQERDQRMGLLMQVLMAMENAKEAGST